MKYSIDWLRKQENPEYLFFWEHQPSKDGRIIKTCLSQLWPSNFKENDIVYRTAEHYMMAAKAELFGDHAIAKDIISKRFPKDVKELGRKIRNVDAKIWDKNKFDIVKQGNYLKFSQNNALELFLLETKNKILVEASPTDTIWGIGLTEDDPNALNVSEWKGQNLLGFALMEVRDLLSTKSD